MSRAFLNQLGRFLAKNTKNNQVTKLIYIYFLVMEERLKFYNGKE